MANLMTLRRLTRSRVGVPMSDDFFPDAVIDDHINLAVQALEGEYHWPWSDAVEVVDVSPDLPVIPFPAGYRATRTIFEERVELHQVAPGDLLAYPNNPGAPRVWCPMADVIALAPPPDTDRQLIHYWYRRPSWLSQDLDTPTIPDQFSGAIVAKAAALLSSREGAGADAGRHSTEYDTWVARMRRDVRLTTMPNRIRVRPGGWL